jgi:hypothetical protein
MVFFKLLAFFVSEGSSNLIWDFLDFDIINAILDSLKPWYYIQEI